MTRILHLSDLHLLRDQQEQGRTLQALVQALRRTVAQDPTRPPSLVALTGDLFDSSTAVEEEALRAFATLLDQLRQAVGPQVPVVVQPGNHDRRRNGVIGPHRGGLFAALRREAAAGVYVGGCSTPFLAEYIPREIHRLPLHVVAYDTTYLPRGLISAGGILRQEDLLQTAARITREDRAWPSAEPAAPGSPRPLLLLLHHHLIPTPLTDLGKIDFQRLPWYARWGVTRLLPLLVANADHEELTMTALGSGTALSTLHALERPVLVLHGHKHYPAARLLRGLSAEQGDVLITSAGSTGTVQHWQMGDHPDAAGLWPSFNVIDLERDGRLVVRSVSFAPTRPGAPLRERDMLRAQHRGASWAVEPIGDAVPDDLRTAEDRAEVELRPSAEHPGARWDLHYQRVVQRRAGHDLQRYLELVADAPDVIVTDIHDADGTRFHQRVPARLRLVLEGVTTYRVCGGASSTLREAQRRFGPAEAFEWVGLLVRYGSQSARLVLRGLPAGTEAFGSATDLGTGYERPWSLQAAGDGAVELDYRNCPARTLLRIYWPLPE